MDLGKGTTSIVPLIRIGLDNGTTSVVPLMRTGLGKGIGFSRAVMAQAFLFCALAPEVSSSLWNQTAQCSRAGDRHRRTMDAQSRKRGQWRGCAYHLLHRGSKWGERRP